MEQVGAPPPGDLAAAATSFAERGATPMFVARGGQVLGVIAVADAVKPGAADAVAALHRMGVRTAMLSGDRPEVAATVASACGVGEYQAGMLPADKAEVIAGMQAQGHTVAMVGDGINDAPALARANVGIAMGGGTDIARETADVTLMRDDLAGVATALRLSRSTMRTIRQNLFWAFFYNTLLIPVAAGALYPVFAAVGGVPGGLTFFFGEAGFLNPILAALAMAFSSVSVVSNSLRLRRANLG
ncbi:Probable copper-exporting P-type ATPase V [Geodia barretti]|uniref:Probable copper-exporting P-type ATPase V n=2 Tax=Geodia barretti TaxID=519541 RepID=A0AA35RNV9_GEOBA|nr:Probable copper-exporting P-type ATPase V [Geodia barretti]